MCVGCLLIGGRGRGGVQNSQKNADVINERPLMSYVLCCMSYVLCLVNYVLCLRENRKCMEKLGNREIKEYGENGKTIQLFSKLFN